MSNDLRVGARNEAVTKVQTRLVELGYLATGQADGFFGPLTFEATRKFQSEHGLTVDGIVGMRTIDKLFPELVPVYEHPVRGKVRKLTLMQVLSRANGCIGAPIKYHLEYPNGGTDPDENMPCDTATGFLDCAGFVAWCSGYDRWQKGKFPYYDGYLNTDSSIAEAEQKGLWFTVLAKPELGCIIVGETYRNLLGQKRIGHTGIVVATDHWADKGLAGISVVHCSPSNYKYGESAVFKTNASIWGSYKKLRFLKFNAEYASKLTKKCLLGLKSL